MGKKALVAGASGLVGRELVKLLLNDRAYEKVTVLVRSRMNIVHPKLDQQIIDYDLLEHIDPGFIKGIDLYCTLGTTMKKAGTKENFRRVDYEYPMVLGRLAQCYGAERMLIVTAMGANAKSMFFYNRVKGQIEDDLHELQLRSLHIFRPSLIVGDRDEHRAGEELASALAKRLPVLFRGKLEKFKPVAAKAIAQSMINVATMAREAPRVISSIDMMR